jgi:hypothetical protein
MHSTPNRLSKTDGWLFKLPVCLFLVVSTAFNCPFWKDVCAEGKLGTQLFTDYG